jgi:putative oxidoreductase
MLNGIIASYRGLISLGNGLQDLLLLGSRLYWGYIFFNSGLEKFSQIPETAKYFASINIPLAELNAYAVAGIEFGGGLCLMAGLAARLVWIPLAVTMAIALATAHIGGTLLAFADPSKFLVQLPVTFLLVCLMIFCFGPGRISVDNVLELLVNGKSKK